MTIFGLSSYFSAELMYHISPQTLLIISGILSASAGVVWFVRMRRVKNAVHQNAEILSEA
jgi:hypothetical protein